MLIDVRHKSPKKPTTAYLPVLCADPPGLTEILE
jgi:hypothetical protein